jgi:hypothetical protein
MAESTEPTHEEIVTERQRFQTVPLLPKGVEVSDRVHEFYDDKVAEANALPDGPERDETLRAIHDLVGEVKARIPEPPPGPVVTRNQRIGSAYHGDPSRFIGKAITEEHDANGKLVSQTVLSKEDTAAMQKQVRDRVDAREGIRDLDWRVKNLRALANDNEAAGATSAATALREEADQLSREAVARMEALKASVPQEEWSSSELGPPPPPLHGDVKATVEAIRDGRLDDAVATVSGVGEKDEQGNPRPAEGRGSVQQYRQKFLGEVLGELSRAVGDREADDLYDQLTRRVEEPQS